MDGILGELLVEIDDGLTPGMGGGGSVLGWVVVCLGHAADAVLIAVLFAGVAEDDFVSSSNNNLADDDDLEGVGCRISTGGGNECGTIIGVVVGLGGLDEADYNTLEEADDLNNNSAESTIDGTAFHFRGAAKGALDNLLGGTAALGKLLVGGGFLVGGDHG